MENIEEEINIREIEITEAYKESINPSDYDDEEYRNLIETLDYEEIPYIFKLNYILKNKIDTEE